MKHRAILCWAIGLVVCHSAHSPAFAVDRHPMWNYPPDLPEARVQTYKNVDDVELKAWIFQPDGKQQAAAARPAIVFFFGGGWRAGTPGQFYNQCKYLASRGMVAITVDYRVRNRHQVLAPTCLADAKSAIRWVRQHAQELGVDPNRIVAAGGSAGGHLAACLGIVSGFDDPQDDLSVSPVPNAMALYNPAVLLAQSNDGPAFADEWLQDIFERTGGKPRELSPLLHIRPKLPPTIIFHGTADEAVKFWTVELFQKKMATAGNRCELKTYLNAPHGFFNTGRGGSPERQDNEALRFASTTSQLDRFLVSLGYLSGEATLPAIENRNIRLRSPFPNSWASFSTKNKARVAFMGGSITEMEGYRPRVASWLTERFPDTEFDFVNAGIASTCSLTGAARVERDVLGQEPLDLLIVEFAVNDDQDAAHSLTQSVRAMEGLIRHVGLQQPSTDIVMVHFVNPSMLAKIQSGTTPTSIEAHERVARHYGINSVYLARELADRVTAGTMTWKDYGGTHPGPAGNDLAADLVEATLSESWRVARVNSLDPRPAAMPSPLDLHAYSSVAFLATDAAQLGGGWTREIPRWNSIPGSLRKRFAGRKLLVSTQPDSELVVDFHGKMLAAYVLAGPDAGRLEVTIDGGPPKTVELYHRFSRGLHYPRTVLLADDLPQESHRARLRVAPTRNENSKGTAIRILELVGE